MRSLTGQTTLRTFSKNLLTQQNYDDLIVKLNTGGIAFDATHGLGQASATSTLVLAAFGGFDDVRVVGIMKFPSPTTAGAEDLGLVMGMRNVETIGAGANYLYIRVAAGNARIVSVIAGSFSTLTTAAWSVAQGVAITIDATRVGRLVTATFTAASGPAPVTLSFTLPSDSPLLPGGLCGFRSLSKAVWCSSLTAEQLA